MVTIAGSAAQRLGPNLHLPRASYVMLGKLLSLSEPCLLK